MTFFLKMLAVCAFFRGSKASDNHCRDHSDPASCNAANHCEWVSYATGGSMCTRTFRGPQDHSLGVALGSSKVVVDCPIPTHNPATGKWECPDQSLTLEERRNLFESMKPYDEINGVRLDDYWPATSDDAWPVAPKNFEYDYGEIAFKAFRVSRVRAERSPIHYHEVAQQICLDSGKILVLVEGEPDKVYEAPDCYLMPAYTKASTVSLTDKVETALFRVPKGGLDWVVIEPNYYHLQGQWDNTADSPTDELAAPAQAILGASFGSAKIGEVCGNGARMCGSGLKCQFVRTDKSVCIWDVARSKLGSGVGSAKIGEVCGNGRPMCGSGLKCQFVHREKNICIRDVARSKLGSGVGSAPGVGIFNAGGSGLEPSYIHPYCVKYPTICIDGNCPIPFRGIKC